MEFLPKYGQRTRSYFVPGSLVYREGVMLAILVVIGTKYACNLDHVGDQICLQSQLKWGPYMPPIETEIAGIFGPLLD